MKRNRKFYNPLIANYNRSCGTHIRLVDGARNVLLPRVDLTEQTIRFNDRIETMLMIFNLFVSNWNQGSRAIHHFLLYHLALDRNMYGKAEELLGLLDADVAQLSGEMFGEETYRTFVIFQTSIALSHEMCHVYYALHPDLLEDHIVEMSQILIARQQRDNTLPFLLRILQSVFKSLEFVQLRFDEILGDRDLLEELCCDEIAWNLVNDLISLYEWDAEWDSDQMATIFAHVSLFFSYIEIKRTLENIYLDPGRDIFERDGDFDRSRLFACNMLGLMRMDKYGKEAVDTFQSLISNFVRSGHVALSQTMRGELAHIAYIRRMPRGKYSFMKLKRLDALYDKVDERIRSYMGG